MNITAAGPIPYALPDTSIVRARRSRSGGQNVVGLQRCWRHGSQPFPLVAGASSRLWPVLAGRPLYLSEAAIAPWIHVRRRNPVSRPGKAGHRTIGKPIELTPGSMKVKTGAGARRGPMSARSRVQSLANRDAAGWVS